MNKQEYIDEITRLMRATDDQVMLQFIYTLLKDEEATPISS